MWLLKNSGSNHLIIELDAFKTFINEIRLESFNWALFVLQFR